MAKSILDLMSADEKQKALDRAEKRLSKKVSSGSVSPELFIVGELGYYYGWDAVMAIRRGYTVEYDSKGSIEKVPFTLEEATALIEAAKKVWYSKLIEQSHGNMVAGASKWSKDPGKAFNTGMEAFSERARVE